MREGERGERRRREVAITENGVQTAEASNIRVSQNEAKKKRKTEIWASMKQRTEQTNAFSGEE